MNLLKKYIKNFLFENISSQYYIRFGLWREDEKSIIWVSDKEEYEKGVSVYPAKWNSEYKKFEIYSQYSGIGTHDPIRTLNALINKFKSGVLPAFLVSGDMVGTGHDGEPLLRNIKKIKQLGCHELYSPQYENPEFGGGLGFGIPGNEHIDCDQEGFKKKYGY